MNESQRIGPGETTLRLPRDPTFDPRSDALRAAWRHTNERQWGPALIRAWQARSKVAAKAVLPPNVIRFGGAQGA